jgi:group I intron endonuclease
MSKHQDKFLGKSEIYMVINHWNGKRYIGQVKCYYDTRKGFLKAGIEKRWTNHCNSARSKRQGTGSRYFENSINKYGYHNHTIKVIHICPEEESDYWETKFIRQYNTLIPNGMNIEKGGKRAPLSQETKDKLSKLKKGKYEGENNPMWNKTHSPESLEKMRIAHEGKPLSALHKQKMSESHTANYKEGKLPPRRKYTDLPKYIYHVKGSNKEGYEVRNHPKLKQRQFVSKTMTLEDNLKRAIAYLEDEDNAKYHKVSNERNYLGPLPRYIRHVQSERYEGFEVKYHPSLPDKKWTSMKITMEEKLELAKNYLLEESSETRCLSVNQL